MKSILMLLLTISLFTYVFSAEIPPQLNYQGRVTDASGAPLPDGNYTITFGIYTSSGAPSPIWTSGPQEVVVTGGLFSYILGSNVSLPHNIFDNQTRYLGIQIESDPEITPRTGFNAVPYAYRALKADTATLALGLAQSIADDFVMRSGDTLSGTMIFHGGEEKGGELEITERAAILRLMTDGDNKVVLNGEGYGTLFLYDDDGHQTAALNATSSQGGNMVLRDAGGVNQIILNGGEIGDISVTLPDNAINSDEILDEPGIATNTRSTANALEITNTASMQDVITVSITTPGPGFIHISARYIIDFSNTTGYNFGYFQIDSTEGGVTYPDIYTLCGMSTYPTTSTYYFPAYSDLTVYESSADTYTYRLEAKKITATAGEIWVYNAKITALYIPTSYGSVTSVVTNPDGFDDAISYQATDEEGNTTTAYEVDLRELELKAKEKKIATQKAYIEQLEAERELERARREKE